MIAAASTCWTPNCRHVADVDQGEADAKESKHGDIGNAWETGVKTMQRVGREEQRTIEEQSDSELEESDSDSKESDSYF